MTTIGELWVKSNHEVEWKIENFFSYWGVDNYYNSPEFSISCSKWHLCVYPNGKTSNDNFGYVSLYLYKNQLTVAGFCYSLGVKNVNGNVEWRTFNSHHVFQDEKGVGRNEFLQRSVLLQRRSELAPSSAVTFICTLRTKTDFESVDILSLSFADLFISKRGCDVTLRVKGKEFSVHKMILMARSSVFAAMFEVDMKEKKMGVVEISDCEPEAFYMFLMYLYSNKIQNISSSNAMELFKIADKYDVQDLKSYCCISIMLNLSLENVLDVVVFADMFSLKKIVIMAQRFFNENFRLILSGSKWDDFFNEHTTLATQLLKTMAKETATDRVCTRHGKPRKSLIFKTIFQGLEYLENFLNSAKSLIF